jgi:hypothetical protein
LSLGFGVSTDISRSHLYQLNFTAVISILIWSIV